MNFYVEPIIFIVEMKNIQNMLGIFMILNQYCKSLHDDLKYIEKIEKECLQNPIDMSCFNQKEFDEVKICRFCKSKFNDCYDDRTIKLQKTCDKEKFKIYHR